MSKRLVKTFPLNKSITKGKVDLSFGFFLYENQLLILRNHYHFGGARGVMIIVAEYGPGDTSSNPGPD